MKPCETHCVESEYCLGGGFKYYIIYIYFFLFSPEMKKQLDTKGRLILQNNEQICHFFVLPFSFAIGSMYGLIYLLLGGSSHLVSD